MIYLEGQKGRGDADLTAKIRLQDCGDDDQTAHDLTQSTDAGQQGREEDDQAAHALPQPADVGQQGRGDEEQIAHVQPQLSNEGQQAGGDVDHTAAVDQTQPYELTSRDSQMKHDNQWTLCQAIQRKTDQHETTELVSCDMNPDNDNDNEKNEEEKEEEIEEKKRTVMKMTKRRTPRDPLRVGKIHIY